MCYEEKWHRSDYSCDDNYYAFFDRLNQRFQERSWSNDTRGVFLEKLKTENIKWDGFLLNALFGLIISDEICQDSRWNEKRDVPISRLAIEVLKAKIISGDLADFHADIYAKIQIGLATSVEVEYKKATFLINHRYKIELIEVLNLLTKPKSLGLNATLSLTRQ